MDVSGRVQWPGPCYIVPVWDVSVGEGAQVFTCQEASLVDS